MVSEFVILIGRYSYINSNSSNNCPFEKLKNAKWSFLSIFGFREVWPENDAFGAADADAEDEFMALREILFADIPKPSHLGDVEEVKCLKLQESSLTWIPVFLSA